MFQPINHSPEQQLKLEEMVYDIIDWSKDRMHELVEASDLKDRKIDDATAIYFEFSEWYDPTVESEVLIVDDLI